MAEVSLPRLTRILVASRIRAQLQYRASFAADLFGQAMLIPLEFIEVYALLHAAPVFGGLTLNQATLLFGLSSLAFGLADMVFGQLDNVHRLIKEGRLEVLLTRPTPLLLQLVTQDIQLRRLGRAGVGLAIYLWAIGACHVEPTVRNLALLVLAPLGGVLIHGAVFLFASATLFFVLDGQQAVNAFTYGGRYASGLPGAALMTPVKIFFSYVVPATLIAYVPTVVLTGGTLPAFWWPGWAWLTVPLGLAMWAVMLGWWRLAIRHYTGAGG
ncbi:MULTISPECIES: ABC transporter permease [unclassified Luteococcus]|uniref:ABC transporter permease n=1 Tax=unclassified Luteococcus TaxID=2639923 RepID=UPI00313BC194